MIFDLIAFGTDYALFVVSGSLVITGLGLAIGGFGVTVWRLTTVSFRQCIIPDDLLGRIDSIYRFFGWGGWGAMPLGALAGSALGQLAQAKLERESALRQPFAFSTCGFVSLLLYALAKLQT